MKYLLTTIALVAVIAGTAGIFAYRASGDKAVRQALAQQDTMEWLRTDFQLTDSQFTAIKQLHDAYSAVCEEHCRFIHAATAARTDFK